MNMKTTTIKPEKNIAEIINNEVISIIANLIRFSFYNPNATRSSNRTDDIHNKLKQIAENIFYISDLNKSKIEIIIDSKKSLTYIPSLGNTNKKFSVDMLVKKNGVNKIAVAVKAPVSSMNKNYNNRMNNEDGELIRVFQHRKNIEDNLTFIQVNLMPLSAPVFNKNKEIKKFEEINTDRPEMDEDYSDECFGLSKRKNVINIYYEVSPKVYDKEKVKNIKDIYIEAEKLKDAELINCENANNLSFLYEKIKELIDK